MTKKLKIAYIIFIFCILGDLTGRVINSQILDYIFKPSLMLWVLWFFLESVKNYKFSWKKWIVLAIIFSWLGDVSLMFAGFHPLFFVIGLGNFLLAHLAYVLAFILFKKFYQSKISIIQKIIFALPVLVIASSFYFVVFDKLGDLKIPVFLYVLVISLMVLSALNRFQKVNQKSFIFTIIGALFFMLSDLLIGLNKFLFEEKLFLAGFFIMITYILAQWLIIKGLIFEIRDEKNHNY